LPSATFTKVTTLITKAVTGLTCATTGICAYNGVCSDIVSKIAPLSFTFGDGLFYNVPASYLIQDSPTAVQCILKIGKQTKGNFVSLGTPFLKAFYTVYNIAAQSVGITFATKSKGTITTSA